MWGRGFLERFLYSEVVSAYLALVWHSNGVLHDVSQFWCELVGVFCLYWNCFVMVWNLVLGHSKRFWIWYPSWVCYYCCSRYADWIPMNLLCFRATDWSFDYDRSVIETECNLSGTDDYCSGKCTSRCDYYINFGKERIGNNGNNRKLCRITLWTAHRI